MKLVILGIVVVLMLMGADSVLQKAGPDEDGVAGSEREDEQEPESGTERIETRIDRGASAFSVKVIPHEVLEDSRCPTDVQCVWAGTVRLRASLESGLGPASQIFELGQPITTEAEMVTLVGVSPAQKSGEIIKDTDYVFFFDITRR